MEFVEPYDNIDDKLGEWSQLSLIMRLNLIESLHQVEKAGAIKFDENIDKIFGDGEEAQEQTWWTETKTEAKRLRISCERSQALCKDPRNWSKYQKSPSRPRGGSKKGGNDGNDGDNGDGHGKGKGKGPVTGKPRASATTKGPPAGRFINSLPFDCTPVFKPSA